MGVPSDVWWERVADALAELGEATSEQLAARLRCSRRWAHLVLQHMHGAGLVTRALGGTPRAPHWVWVLG